MTKINDLIIALNTLNRKNRMAQDEYKYQKEFYENKIKQYLDKKNTNSYDFDTSGLNYKATYVKSKKINFDVELVQQKLDKEIFNEICTKEYRIIDFDGLISYLKSLGANPKEIKKYIYCDKSINKEKVDQLGELGDLTLEDLDGCYTVSENAGYVKVTVKDLTDEEDNS